MNANISTDILVAGAGPAGMAAALALSRTGLSVSIAAPAAARADHRTTALMLPSIRLLEELGVWASLRDKAAPLCSMRIIDGTDRLIRARPVTFHAGELGEEAFGWNMPNEDLNAALSSALAGEESILRLDGVVAGYERDGGLVAARLSDGTVVSARLIVGADGRNSPARDFAGIALTSWDYPQTAFVTTFAHALPHANMSTEFHTPTGPFTQVPLPGNRSSLVWAVAPERAEELLQMDKESLSRAIEDRMQSFLGKIEAGSERQAYPLSGRYPLRFAGNRVALVGEAAHVFPPIGAQGLNLGMRDVEDLAAAIAASTADPGADTVLQAYDRARRPDIVARTGAVDILNRTLLSPFVPAQMLRATGLALLDMLPPLRSLFMREGMRPGSGLRDVGRQLGEKIRRDQAGRQGVKQR